MEWVDLQTIPRPYGRVRDKAKSFHIPVIKVYTFPICKNRSRHGARHAPDLHPAGTKAVIHQFHQEIRGKTIGKLANIRGHFIWDSLLCSVV